MKNKFKNLLILTFCILPLCVTSTLAEESLQEDIIQEETLEIPTDEQGNPLTGTALKIYNLVENAPTYTPTNFKPVTTETETKIQDVSLLTKQTIFENGDIYTISRYTFAEPTDERYKSTFKIEGNQITVRYVNPETKEWVNTSNLNNLLHTTLFIDTDTNSYVVSVPAVYKNDFTNQTLTIVPEEENQIKIEKYDGYYNLEFSFPKNSNFIGEFWSLSSQNKLVDWSQQKSFDDLISHDLAIERRWSYDGYYFITPYNYIPSGSNVLYKHPANYTGASWVKYGTNNLSKELGYVMTETCMNNQNDKGYWATGPKSLWLEEDFQIGANFYDTRFNSDFGVSLLYAYQNYNNKEFLESALKYAEFFLEYAKNHSYEVTGGGILVQDYANATEDNEKTHVSLNHQLSEINFLYRAYIITREETYLNLADEMLLGIENTRNKWVLEDNNLNYALMYTKNTNLMIDYPYLTYNDLYETKNILKTYLNRTNDTIEFLMAAKKSYMDANNITGYLGYKAN